MMDKEQTIALAATIVHFRDAIIRLDGEIADAEKALRVATTALEQAEESLSEAVAEIVGCGSGGRVMP